MYGFSHSMGCELIRLGSPNQTGKKGGFALIWTKTVKCVCRLNVYMSGLLQVGLSFKWRKIRKSRFLQYGKEKMAKSFPNFFHKSVLAMVK